MHPTIELEHDGERVSVGLRPLLQDAYEQMVRHPPELPALKASLVRLFEFLASPLGRTHANCVEADRFFFQSARWPVAWEQLPDAFTDVTGDIGGMLHHAIRRPELAEDYDSLPEQLLERARRLPSGPVSVSRDG